MKRYRDKTKRGGPNAVTRLCVWWRMRAFGAVRFQRFARMRRLYSRNRSFETNDHYDLFHGVLDMSLWRRMFSRQMR